MEKKEMLTVLLFVPTLNLSNNAFGLANIVAQQLGYLNCEVQDDIAAIKYTGIISKEHKEELVKIANENHFRIIFIEAEYETKYVNGDTIELHKVNHF